MKETLNDILEGIKNADLTTREIEVDELFAICGGSFAMTKGFAGSLPSPDVCMTPAPPVHAIGPIPTPNIGGGGKGSKSKSKSKSMSKSKSGGSKSKSGGSKSKSKSGGGRKGR